MSIQKIKIVRALDEIKIFKCDVLTSVEKMNTIALCVFGDMH